MSTAQYAIMRFAKYKGPEIGRIEAHNERTKETYASNPDVDTSRSKYNYHLVTPPQPYRAEAERQIAAAGCRTRKDSVRVVEVLFTASPAFFKGKKTAERRAFFEESLKFLLSRQDAGTTLSAVVHMDEKTPHMHLSFVPLTKDGRLSAKEIVGNKKRLTWWQDEYWKYMVKRFPDLERGESASETGRDHIPPRVFKEMTHLDTQRERLEELLTGVNAFNAKARAAEISKLLDSYLPNVAKMDAQVKRFTGAYANVTNENKRLKRRTGALEKELDASRRTSIAKRLEDAKLRQSYEAAVQILERIPPEIIEACQKHEEHKKVRRSSHAER